MQVNPVAPPWRSASSTTYISPPVNVAPAFTTVSARRALTRPTSQGPVYVPPQQPPSSSTSSSSPEQKQKVNWPLGVRQYVQRAFIPENAIPGIDRQQMESKLKEVITLATEQNRLESTDWENAPLPQQLIQNERKRSMTASTPWAAPVWIQPPAAPVTAPVMAFKPTESGSKKRKSSEIGPDEESNTPPWRKTNNRNVFEDRITYLPNDSRQRQENSNPKPSSKSQAKLEKRKRRFENGRPGYQSPGAGPFSREVSPPARLGPVVGRCMDLEKPYLRLTSEPNPDKVRPLHILEKTLELLKTKWREEKKNYAYICDQFKSLRQDLTVQHIKTEFTVKVYEIHARIALEKGDLGEYNQCQTQLRGLYPENIGGHPMEFLAYRILYFIKIQNRTELNDVLAHLTQADKEDAAVKHALEVRASLASGNYHRFFQLYLDTPNMGAYLLDRFVVRERLAALAKICKTYMPSVPLRFITEELGFENDREAVEFLLEYVNDSVFETKKAEGTAEDKTQENEKVEQEGQMVIRFLTKPCGHIFEQAKSEAFRVVDIKGQL